VPGIPLMVRGGWTALAFDIAKVSL
jgi:hypothetical protein